MPLGAGSMPSLAAGLLNLRGDSSKFLVVFDDGEYDLGSWSRVSGLSVSWDVVEYRTGEDNDTWVGPGVAKYSKISLSRATCSDSALVQKWLVGTSKTPKAYSGSIQLLSWIGVPLCSWTLHKFVPISWKVADFDTKAATVVIETLEIAHSGFLEDAFVLTPTGQTT